MNRSFMDDFRDLPGAPQELVWLRERLETLSVREGHALAAALMRKPPDSAAEAINHIQALDSYEVCFPAGSYEELGEFYLRQSGEMPEDALPYLNLEKLGQQFEDKHPGLFIGDCFVVYPQTDVALYQGQGSLLPEDNGWSVKVKLASPAVPEGVWIRLPDHGGKPMQDSSEVWLALDVLRAGCLKDCTLLEAQCILPEAGDLMAQYDSAAELVQDGDNLGYVLKEEGQGEDGWLAKFAAALEYEGCRTLRFALDIAQNLRCYEWVAYEDLESFAADHLRDCGVSDELIQSGAIDLKGYAGDLLETAGYMLSSGDIGYVARNGREFVHAYTAPEGAEMTMN